MTRQVAPAVKRQVHDQECHVRDGIGVAKTLVEFDAVDDDPIVRRRTVGEMIGMVQTQVAVGVARNSFGRAGVNQLLVPHQGGKRKNDKRVKDVEVNRRADAAVLGRLIKVLDAVAHHDIVRPE